MEKESTLARRLADAFDDQISRLRRVLWERENRAIAASLGIRPKPEAQAQKRRSADDLAQDAKDVPPSKNDLVTPDVPKPAPTIAVRIPAPGGGFTTVSRPIAPQSGQTAPMPQPDNPTHRPKMTLDRDKNAVVTDGWRPLIRVVGTLETRGEARTHEPNVVEGLIDRMRPEEQRNARKRLEESRAAKRAEKIKNSLQQRSDVLEQLNKRVVQKL